MCLLLLRTVLLLVCFSDVLRCSFHQERWCVPWDKPWEKAADIACNGPVFDQCPAPKSISFTTSTCAAVKAVTLRSFQVSEGQPANISQPSANQYGQWDCTFYICLFFLTSFWLHKQMSPAARHQLDTSKHVNAWSCSANFSICRLLMSQTPR